MNNMKSVLTLVLVLFLGTMAIAQNTENNGKVDTFKMGVVLVISTPDIDLSENNPFVGTKALARLYRYPNSRVKKALSFSTKKDSPKLA